MPDSRDVDNGPGGLSGPGRRRAGRFVQSGKATFFPVPVLRTSESTTGLHLESPEMFFLVYTRYIPGIYFSSGYAGNMSGIYLEYTRYISEICIKLD